LFVGTCRAITLHVCEQEQYQSWHHIVDVTDSQHNLILNFTSNYLIGYSEISHRYFLEYPHVVTTSLLSDRRKRS